MMLNINEDALFYDRFVVTLFHVEGGIIKTIDMGNYPDKVDLLRMYVNRPNAVHHTVEKYTEFTVYGREVANQLQAMNASFQNTRNSDDYMVRCGNHQCTPNAIVDHNHARTDEDKLY